MYWQAKKAAQGRRCTDLNENRVEGLRGFLGSHMEEHWYGASCLSENSLVQLHQRRQFSRLDQVEFGDEEQKVAVRRVEVCLDAERTDLRKVVVVDVRIHAEESPEDRLDHCWEVLGKRYADLAGKELLVIQL